MKSIFKEVRKHKIQFNLDKCTFNVRFEKSLGYYLGEKGTKLNLNKCQVVVNMAAPETKKSIKMLKNSKCLVSIYL